MLRVGFGLFEGCECIAYVRTGELDDSYRRDAEGVIGQILDACMVESDGIVIVGTFSSFDGQSVKNIVKLNAEGTLDETFMRKSVRAQMEVLLKSGTIKTKRKSL